MSKNKKDKQKTIKASFENGDSGENGYTIHRPNFGGAVEFDFRDFADKAESPEGLQRKPSVD